MLLYLFSTSYKECISFLENWNLNYEIGPFGTVKDVLDKVSVFLDKHIWTFHRFDQCAVSPLSLKAIKDAGYEKMTVVQEATLPVILKGLYFPKLIWKIECRQFTSFVMYLCHLSRLCIQNSTISRKRHTIKDFFLSRFDNSDKKQNKIRFQFLFKVWPWSKHRPSILTIHIVICNLSCECDNSCSNPFQPFREGCFG